MIIWLLTGYRTGRRNLPSLLALLNHTGFNYQACFSGDGEKLKAFLPLLYENAIVPEKWSCRYLRQDDHFRLFDLVSTFVGMSHDFCEKRVRDWKQQTTAHASTSSLQNAGRILSRTA